MKKALLSIAAMALLSSQGFAQITLTNTSFTNPLNTTDTFRYISSGYNSTTNTADPDNIRPERATGFVWYLDALTYNYTKAPRVIQHVAASGYDYANRTVDTLNHKTHTTTSPQWVYMPEYLTKHVANSGIEEYGIAVPATGYSLSTLPLAMPTDSLKIPAQNAMYFETTISNNPETRIKLKFPVTMGTGSWVNTYQDTIHGTLRYTVAGLIDTPFHIKTEVQETKRVAGYGKLKFRKPTYMTPAFTDTLNILQVRCTLQVKDFYYIGPNQADSTTLSYIGVNGQGATRLYYYDEYYRASIPEPVITFRFTDATFQNANFNQSDANLRSLNPTEVAMIENLTNIEVYPNPVQNGLVNININGTQNNWNYSVININGQSVKAGKLNVNGGKAQVALPSNLPAGTYQMLLENGDETIVKSLSIVE